MHGEEPAELLRRMKLADAVAVYEGRRPPRMSQLPIDQFVDEFLVRASRQLSAQGMTDDTLVSHLTQDLTAELERVYPLLPRIKRVGGTRRPRTMTWSVYLNANSGGTPTLNNLYIRGVKYRSRRNLTAVTIVSYGRRFYSDAHRELAFAAGLDEIDMLVLLSCNELGRSRHRWNGDSTGRVAPQYVELLAQLHQVGMT